MFSPSNPIRETQNAKTLAEFVRLSEDEWKADVVELLKNADILSYKGVQTDDGYSYTVPAKDLVNYAETIRELITLVVDLRPDIYPEGTE